jgi:hypothetical protein
MRPVLRLTLAALCAASVSNFLCAQKHDYYMVFGYGSTPETNIVGGTDINFNFWPPDTSYVFREMNFAFNAAAICDENGNLLFYTNGCSINGADHQQISNGDSLNPGIIHDGFCGYGYRAAQGSTFLPHPGNPDLYYLFHLGLNYYDGIGGVGDKFYYTLIDKTLDNGHGEVVKKNQVLLEDTLAFGLITATKHANGRDWWIVAPEMATPKHYVFLLTPYGVFGPEEQIIGNIQYDDDGTGNAVFSPDGTKYARFDWYNQLDVFDFDRCTGVFSNPQHLSILEVSDTLPGIGGVAFSPNSRFLYLTKVDKVFQYDTWSIDLQASKQLIAVYDGGVINNISTGFFLPQLGPDGRVYICSSSAIPVMHLIEWPNRAGVSANVIQRGFPLPTYNAWAMCFFPNFRLGPKDGSNCDTLGLDNNPIANFRWDMEDTLSPLQITFTDLSSYEPTYWQWHFGDGSTSQDTNVVHSYTAPNTYNVCLTVSNTNGSNTLCRLINVGVTSDIHEPEYKQKIVEVYPNPVTSDVFFLIHMDERHYKIKIYDIYGRLMNQKSGRDSFFSLDLENLPEGMYLYDIQIDNSIRVNGKIMKANK